MDKLMIVVASGLTMLGRLEGNKLMKPRKMVSYKEKDKDSGMEVDKIHLSAMPLLPPFVVLESIICKYPLPEREKQIYELYEKLTHFSVDPG